jgi:hypothetical protein
LSDNEPSKSGITQVVGVVHFEVGRDGLEMLDLIGVAAGIMVRLILSASFRPQDVFHAA